MNCYEPPASTSATLNQERGAFVTLTKSGELRGCIGYTSAIKPLYMTVRDTATLAATARSALSSRYRPRSCPASNMKSPCSRRCAACWMFNRSRVGEHGLLMKNGDNEGLLLPQVPVEQKWDRQTFLEQTCRKAGMDPAAGRTRIRISSASPRWSSTNTSCERSEHCLN